MSAADRRGPARGVSLTGIATAMLAVELLVVWLFAGVWFPGLI